MIAALTQVERERFVQANPVSQALAQRSAQHWLFGVPLHWMNDWATPFALHVKQARGAVVEDVDGNCRIDFCLGDTGAMFGHAAPAIAAAVAAQMHRSCTTMLASADAAELGEVLMQRFGLPYWQAALSASDANRFLLRWVRAATGRRKLLVFNGCYHGTVDDVFVDLVQGRPQMRDSLLGQVHDLLLHTEVIEFNDLAALERALRGDEIACVLAEPVMTNVGMVLPDAGFWEQAQALIRQHGACLVMDETHTLSSGPGGYCRAHGLQPDALVLGKPIGGGLPCAVYGFSAELAERAMQAKRAAAPGHSGIGTTLGANMLALAAMRATLREVATEAAYAHMTGLCNALARGLRECIAKHCLPWCVTQVGARCEFQFSPTPPRNGSQAAAAFDPALEQLIHLALLNRGLMITPFHNMLLLCPDTTEGQVQQLLLAFDEVLGLLSKAQRGQAGE